MSDLIYYTTAVVEEEGVLVLRDLALKEGQRVEVTVYGTGPMGQGLEDPLTLRGEPFYDEDPFEPVALKEWEALQ